MATIDRLPEIEQLELISHSFHQFALKFATKHLSMCSRSNVIYKLAKAIGTMRPNGLD